MFPKNITKTSYMNHQNNTEFILGIAFSTLIFSENAYAYINPSVFGLIIVALSGFAAVIGFYFYRIIAFVKFCFVGLKSFFVGLFIKK